MQLKKEISYIIINYQAPCHQFLNSSLTNVALWSLWKMSGGKLHQPKDDFCSLALSSTSVIKLSCSPSEGADLILSTLLCVVLYCWLLNCKVWAVEGECCWSPLNSRSPVWLTPCGNPTEIPLHTSERSSSLSGAPQEYCCVPPWVRGPSSHTTALVLRLLQLLVFRVQ